MCELVAQSSLTPCDPRDYSPPGPLSMVSPKQEYFSELPFPSPGDVPDLGIETRSPTLQMDSLLSEPPGKLQLPISFKKHVWVKKKKKSLESMTDESRNSYILTLKLKITSSSRLT